jgi:redox-sensitive bicupin YhaK (pirin superfamily)
MLQTQNTTKITPRRSNERGLADHGWLKSMHTFSFANYYDPKHMGFRALRVINEDRIAGGSGFGSHPHKDMEIISYVVKGRLQHQDSMGTKAVISPGEVQRMSAGSGVVHSEMNAMKDEETHFFQIWVLPKAPGGTPAYGQKSFAEDLATKKSVLVLSEDGRDGSIEIQQDMDMYISRLPANGTFEHALRPGRGAWIQVVRGDVEVNGERLHAGDAISLENTSTVQVLATNPAEVMLFDLA